MKIEITEQQVRDIAWVFATRRAENVIRAEVARAAAKRGGAVSPVFWQDLATNCDHTAAEALAIVQTLLPDDRHRTMVLDTAMATERRIEADRAK